MRYLQVFGLSLIFISILLFILDITRMGMLILQIFAVLNIVSPFLSGKKIAEYLHDSKFAKKKGFKVSPMGFVYFWLFVWIVFMLLYTLFTLIFSYSIKYLISSFKADYLGIIYTLIMIFGSYIYFIEKSKSRDEFLTSWGRALERTKKLSTYHAKNVVNKAKNFEKYL